MADLDLSGRKVGEFVLRERIGAGGHSTVYRCEQPALRRDAVVKVLRTGRFCHDPDQQRLLRVAAQDRFLREAQLASRLDHPYAAHVYSFGVEPDDGLLWIAMERVQGMNLGEWLQAHGPMPLAQFVPFFEAVAQVVQTAHERGIVHRDLKPSNIMVLETAGRLLPKLLDFGIAKLDAGSAEPTRLGDATLDAAADGIPTVKIRVTPQLVQRTRTGERGATGQLTQPGAMLGSAPYMSPEQWAFPHSVGPATDIYSLGCVAYETLTGRMPFAAADIAGYFDRHLRADPPPLGASFSPSLERVLRRALAKDPGARPASVQDLAAEFAAAARSDPRERLRSAAQEWHAHARATGLLWRRDVLAEVARSTLRTSRDALSELECSFMAASQRRARMLRWATRSIAALVLAGVLGVLQYRSAMQARIADEQARLVTQEVHAARALADARAIESELEQGRAALLHGEPEALPHLARAYRSEPSATTAFMLARAMEPRLAERARLASTFGRMWWAAFVGLQVAVLEGPQGVVRTAGFGPNQQVVDASWDGTARVWDAASPFRRFSSDPIGRECGRVMGAVPEGRFIAIGCGMRPTAVWDTAQDRLLTELPAATPSVTGGYASAFPAISADGDRAAIARGNTVALYEIPGGRLLRTIEHKAAISAVAFASDGRDLATGAIDGSTTVTRDDGSSEVLQAGAGVDTVELLPDGRVVVSDAARRLRVYGANGAILADLETPSRIRSLRRAGDRIVALPSYTGPIVPPVLVDLERYRMVALLDSHTGQVFSARWTRDQRIITAGADGAARLWDGATGLPLQTYAGGTRFLADAMLTPDGLVIGGDADGLVRIWDGATGAKLWILQAHKSAVIGVHIAGDGSGDIVTLGSTGEISRWRLRRPEQVIDACVHEPLCAVLPR